MFWIKYFTLLFLFGITVQCQQIYDFGIMMDAGSTSTRLYIYRWPQRVGSAVPQVESVFDNVTQSNAVYRAVPDIVRIWLIDEDHVKDYLTNLMNYAKLHIPQNKWSTTPVFFRAGAVLRTQSISVQNQILTLVRNHCKQDVFLFQDSYASVINGQEEGTWAWVTVNFLSGTLGQASTFGALDMGGSSTQIAFAHPRPLFDVVPVSFNNRNYTLYVRSHPGYGQDTSLDRYKSYLIDASENITTISANCFLNGYTENVTSPDGTVYQFVGTGNSAACYDEVSSFFDKEADCAHTPCSFNGIYQPVLTGKFYAFNGFFFTANFLFGGATQNLTINQFQQAGNQFCAKNWTSVLSQYPSVNTLYLRYYCFNANYYSSLLSYGYGFNRDDQNPIFASTVRNTDLGWALGAMVLEASLLTSVPSNGTVSTTGTAPVSTTGGFSTTGDEVPTSNSTSGDLSGFGQNKKFDWAGAILATFFGILILIIFVLVVIAGVYNSYKKKNQTAV